jgi:enamine deaminase RidA (YjgF/YER057c/UK114 family)
VVADRQTVRIGAFSDLIASGVRVGDTLHLSGQVSVDDAGNVVGAGNLEAQMRQAYANLAAVLDAFGATVSDIVDETWFVTDMRDTMARVGELMAISTEAYGGQPNVAHTLVQISELVFPELLIEIKCTARL